MSGLTRWAISPTDGRDHSLPEGDHPPGVLQARCGHLLPLCVEQHDHLPGRQWCVPCMVAHLLPAPVSPPQDSVTSADTPLAWKSKNAIAK